MATTPLTAASEICKYVDPEGNITYTNVAPGRGWKKLSCEGEPSRPGGSSARTPTPTGFPRVDASTQRSRDDVRRRVLADELSTEERLLADARSAFANGAPPREGDEQSNAQKYAERVARLRQSVSLHEKNVEALKKELASLR